MAYGDTELSPGSGGPEVVELQMRLAGFRGTTPDGDYGPGTARQVASFQRDVMGLATQSGHADQATFQAIETFGADHPIDFDRLKCPCGVCTGFGQGRFKGRYRSGKPKVEAYHRYEYPGLHRMLLWAFRAAEFYCGRQSRTLLVTSGYRCAEDNKQHGRKSTNHHGKALDFDIPGSRDKRQDMQVCEEVRGLLVETADAQIGWSARNRKSLEPARIAPTWVHYDVRSYARVYLDDRYFVTSAAALDRAP